MLFKLHFILFLASMTLFSQGEGGAFTSSRLSALKTGEGSLGNNPSALNWFNDVRNKTAKLGVNVKLGLDDIAGTVYLNEVFQLGTIYYGNEPYGNFQLRYDAFNDEIELKRSKESEIEALQKNKKISCLLNNERFVFKSFSNSKNKTDKGYLIVLFEGRQFTLYQRSIKVFKEGKPAKTSLQNSFPHRFRDQIQFYISFQNGPAKKFELNKKGVVKLFPELNPNEVKSYMKTNKVDVKKKADLLNLMAYINTLYIR